MKWLGRWIVGLINKANQDDDYSSRPTVRGRATLSKSSDVDGEEGLNITVRKAIGGKIVSFRTYDHKQDRNHFKIYVVPDEMDFDKELSKMITLESMRL